jgi:hypothetical protein
MERRRGISSNHTRAGVERPISARAISSPPPYIAPEARVGLALGPHVELILGIEMLLAFSVSPPTWSSTREIDVLLAGPAGHYPAEVYSSPSIVSFSPSMGARYDF